MPPGVPHGSGHRRIGRDNPCYTGSIERARAGYSISSVREARVSGYVRHAHPVEARNGLMGRPHERVYMRRSAGRKRDRASVKRPGDIGWSGWPTRSRTAKKRVGRVTQRWPRLINQRSKSSCRGFCFVLFVLQLQECGAAERRWGQDDGGQEHRDNSVARVARSVRDRTPVRPRARENNRR